MDSKNNTYYAENLAEIQARRRKFNSDKDSSDEFQNVNQGSPIRNSVSFIAPQVNPPKPHSNFPNIQEPWRNKVHNHQPSH